jgi:hypothetical protein
MIDRHQDYQITVATIPAGGLIGVPLQLDTDAPFKLRLVRSRNLGLSGFNFQTPKQAYQSSGFRTDVIPQTPFQPAAYFPSRGVIVDPEMIYPMSSTILIDLGNTTGAALTDVRVLFRGSKLYADGAVSQSANYPDKLRVLPFTYAVIVRNVPAVTTTPIQNIPLNIKNDADFVFRYGVCDPFTLGVDGGAFNQFNFKNLYVTLRDEWYKPYSNQPIHVNDLFGQGQPSPFQATGANDDDVLFLPTTYTPEIYIERNHSIYFDVVRNDPGGGPVDLHFRFQGVKVFRS